MSFIKDLLKWGVVRAVTNNLTGGIDVLTANGEILMQFVDIHGDNLNSVEV